LRRRPSAERLDDPALPPDEMRRSLEDLRLVNRHWGGSRALGKRLLKRLGGGAGRRILVVDVGAGSGDVARRLEATLREAGLDVRVFALDLQWRHLAAGRAMTRAASDRPMARAAADRAMTPAAVDRATTRGAAPVTDGSGAAAAADAFCLPLADHSVDVAVSSLFFHHFSPEQNARILRELSRVARRGFAVLDLRRSFVPWAFVAVAGRAVFRARVSVEDGVASVRQAYTPAEAESIARAVVPGSAVRRVFPFRFLLEGGGA